MNGIEGRNKKGLAIVVVSYDGYSDLWDDYFYLLNKHWSNRPYNTYLANNIKNPTYKDVAVINGGQDAQWSTRTRIAVEKVKEPYICLMLEDFYIGSKVNNKVISDVIDFIKSENIKYYKLNTFSKINSSNYKGYDYLYNIPANLDYGISLQPAIWEREYLLELLGKEDYNAWNFEFARIKDSSIESKEPLKGCIYDNRNILNICHGVVQGKYLPPAIRYFKKQNYQLNITQRPIMTNREYIFYRLKGIGGKIAPKRSKKSLKIILSKLGMNFVSK